MAIERKYKHMKQAMRKVFSNKKIIKSGELHVTKKTNYKYMKSTYTLLFFWMICITAFAQESQDSLQIRLIDAWQRADYYSKELQLEQLAGQISHERVADAKSQWAPHLDAEARYGKLANIPIFVDGLKEDPEFIPLKDHSTYNFGMQAYFNIYDGHKVKIANSEAETKETIQQYITKATVSDVHFKVAEYYLNILRSLEFKKIIEHNIYRNNERLSQINELYKHGVILKSDVLRAQLQLSQQKTKLLQVKNNLEIAHQNLNMALGYNDTTTLVLTDSIWFDVNQSIISYDDYVLLTKEQSPLMKIAETQTKLSALQKRQIRSSQLPKIGLYGEYIYSYPQNRWYPYTTAPYMLGTAGLKISYNIASLYTNKHKISAASIEIQKQIVAEHHTEEALRSKVKTAYSRFLEDKENIEVGKINIEQAEENYKIVSQTYFNKLALITDLLEADTQLLQAKFDMVNNYVLARLHYYQLLKITGQL